MRVLTASITVAIGIGLGSPANAGSIGQPGTIRYEVSLDSNWSDGLLSKAAHGWSASFEIADLGGEIRHEIPTAISVDGTTIAFSDPYSGLFLHDDSGDPGWLMWEGAETEDGGFNWIASKELWDVVNGGTRWKDLPGQTYTLDSGPESWTNIYS